MITPTTFEVFNAELLALLDKHNLTLVVDTERDCLTVKNREHPGLQILGDFVDDTYLEP